jgi:hypothetical protein
VKEDKPNKPIPQEAERLASRLIYGAQKAKESKAKLEKDHQDPEEVEWVAQWTYGTVQRLAEKTKIGVEKWRGHPPDEIKESHLYQEKPKMSLLKYLFGEFIVKDRDFRLIEQPAGKWTREHPIGKSATAAPAEPV